MRNTVRVVTKINYCSEVGGDLYLAEVQVQPFKHGGCSRSGGVLILIDI